jgi:phage shock protein A
MKKTTSTTKMTSQLASSTAIHIPQWSRNFEQIRKRAEEFYAARNGMIGMTLNDWLKAEQELKQEPEKQITNK